MPESWLHALRAGDEVHETPSFLEPLSRIYSRVSRVTRKRIYVKRGKHWEAEYRRRDGVRLPLSESYYLGADRYRHEPVGRLIPVRLVKVEEKG